MAEFSEGKDIIAVSLNAAGNQVTNVTQIASGFNNPLAVATDLSGRIYVAEYGEPAARHRRPDHGAAADAGRRDRRRTRGSTSSRSPRRVPTGYSRDFGEAFNTETNYGWIDQSDSNPLSLIGNGVHAHGSVRSAPRHLHGDAIQRHAARGGDDTGPLGDRACRTARTTSPSRSATQTRIDSVDQLSANGTVLVNQFHPTGTDNTSRSVRAPDHRDQRRDHPRRGGRDEHQDRLRQHRHGHVRPARQHAADDHADAVGNAQHRRDVVRRVGDRRGRRDRRQRVSRRSRTRSTTARSRRRTPRR